MSRNKEERSPYMIERYRIRLDHDVQVEPKDPGEPIYVRAEPTLAIDIHVDTAACIPKDEILDMLLRRLKEGCFCIDPMQIYELPAIDVIEVGKKYYMDAGFRVICGMEEVQKTKAGEGEGTLLLFPGNTYFMVERIV